MGAYSSSMARKRRNTQTSDVSSSPTAPKPPETQTPDDAPRHLAASNGHATASILANANNVNIKDSTLMIVNNAAKSTLKALFQRVAPNAILNKGGRADDAKCHPGTREEVIGLIERWVEDAESDRIFWMSGPAGAGKTAIMKTITERSAERSVQTINFFFFREDSTRKSAQPVVATILYQLFQRYPSAVEVIAKIFSNRPRILDESMEEQCKLISTLIPIIRKSSPTGIAIVLLIDGLDECDVEAELSQPDILRAFEYLVMQADSPFCLLVASRPEPRIQMTFNQLPSHTRSIFLDEDYSPEDDIRLFVLAEFDSIKASHPNKRSLLRLGDWPSSSDVEEIIAKSSGQFIFAATAMRFISDPSTVPSLSLEWVMGIVPTVNNSPFTNLDDIYMSILNQVKDQDATRDMLAVSLLGIDNEGSRSHLDMLHLFSQRYSRALTESCTSKLSAIVQLTDDGIIKFYHASLADFLTDQARSGPYWIDVDAFRADFLVVLWKKGVEVINQSIDYYVLLDLFNGLQKPNPELKQLLLNASIDWFWIDNDLMADEPLFVLEKFYYHNDIETYKHILRRVVRMVASNYGIIDSDVPYAKEYYLLYKRED